MKSENEIRQMLEQHMILGDDHIIEDAVEELCRDLEHFRKPISTFESGFLWGLVWVLEIQGFAWVSEMSGAKV
jgi:hypothetical protein